MSKMYSHGSLEMNDLFGDSPASPLMVTVSDHTSFENETESLYMTQLEGLGQLTSPEGKDVLSSVWNADLCGSLLLHPRDRQPRQPKRPMIGSMMAMVRPEDVTGQTPIKKEEEEEVVVVDDDEMAIVEANFDLSTLADAGPPLAESTMVEETQEAIDDMAAFLQSYEAVPVSDEPATAVKTEMKAEMSSCLADELLSLEQRQTLDQMDTTVPDDDDGLAAVEALCDSLLAANNPPQTVAATDILQAAVDSEGLADSGYQTLPTEDLPLVSQDSRYTVANVSHCVTSAGQKVIIVVQRPEADPTPTSYSPASSRKLLLPKPEAAATTTDETDEDSDSSWTPATEQQPKRRKPGRKRVVSLVTDQSIDSGRVKKSYKNIKDRKERKKWQNVEAARRYRLKKKQEEEEMEAAEEVQRARNDKLREQLKDVQSELNTMKKLMKEMGMLKTVRSGTKLNTLEETLF